MTQAMNQDDRNQLNRDVAGRTGLSSLLDRLVTLRPGEGAVLLLSAAYFFFLLLSYFLLRPVRDAFGIARGADQLPWLITATMLAMFLVNPLFGAVVSRMSRQRFIPLAYRFFAVNLVIFFVLLRASEGEGRHIVGYVFFVWLSVFNVFVVSVFWAFMSDVYNMEQGKRLYGMIAAGGTLGTVCGSLLVKALVNGFGTDALRIEPAALLLIAVVPLELAVQCVRRLNRLRPPIERVLTKQPSPLCVTCGYALTGNTTGKCPECGHDVTRTPLHRGGSWEGVRLIAGSRYLQAIALYVMIYSTTSTILYLELNRWIADLFPDERSRTAAFANVDLLSNTLTVCAQLLLTARVVRWLGVGGTMSLVPAITLLGFAGLMLRPSYNLVAGFQIIRRSSHFVFDRPARETLYTVLSAQAKYKAKPFIDTFVYRAGDQIGAWLPGLLSSIGASTAVVSLPLAALWMVLAFVVGRGQKSAAAGP